MPPLFGEQIVELRKYQQCWYEVLEKSGVAQDGEQPHSVEQPQAVEKTHTVLNNLLWASNDTILFEKSVYVDFANNVTTNQ